ncbi:MAG: Mur ligase domain-containing protein, partial [Saccharofermentanales bacterium]
MSMMFSLSEIVNATEGRLIYSNNVMQDIGTIYVTGVSKDSRTIEEGQLFVALKGEKFDGHEFCEEV